MVSAQEMYINDDGGGNSETNQRGSSDKLVNNLFDLERIPRKAKSTAVSASNTQTIMEDSVKSYEATGSVESQDETDANQAPTPSDAIETTDKMKQAAKRSHTLDAWKNYDLDKPKLPILRKGDLVRISQEARSSGRIQGGLARVIRVHRSELSLDHDGDGHKSSEESSAEPAMYDVEYVLGGKVNKIPRHDLIHTTAEAEGLVDPSDDGVGGAHPPRGRLLRKRQAATNPAQEDQEKAEEESATKKAKKKKTQDHLHSATVSSSTASSISSSRSRKEQNRSKKGGYDVVPKSPSRGRGRSLQGDVEDATPEKQPISRGRGRPKKPESSPPISSKQATSAGKRRRNSKTDIDSTKSIKESPSSKGCTSKSNTSKTSSSKRGNKRTSATDIEESDSNADGKDLTTSNVDEPQGRALDMYIRHKKEMDRSITRLEKMDRFAFFLDQPPSGFDENYSQDGSGDANSTVDESEKKQTPSTCYESSNDREWTTFKRKFSFPDYPPFNLIVLRKRFDAGWYDLDMVAEEIKRRKEIGLIMHVDVNNAKEKKSALEHDEKLGCDPAELSPRQVNSPLKEKPKKTDCNRDAIQDDYQDDDTPEQVDITLLSEYQDLAKTMYHPIGVDWEKLNSDVVGMCDAAIERDPEGVNLGSGHLGFAAHKIKKLMEEMYNKYGCKRRVEMEESEAKNKFKQILLTSGNTEPAMQGEWRKHAFPERKYERLENASVVCDGLSEIDKSYAIYELGTSIPDSFVGLAYTYTEGGQESEAWMKTVADETSQSTDQPLKVKKKKKDAADPNNVRNAAIALAKDEGVVRAQVRTTMTALLIQVQDKVMTDLGVMHQPEARSANWDDGDNARCYRGGAMEVEQGFKVSMTSDSNSCNSNGSSLPEVAEQPVWGIDCWTRRNVTSVIEAEFSPEIAVEFVEKWLLPAINACPVEIAHNMAAAAKILEGLEPSSREETKHIDYLSREVDENHAESRYQSSNETNTSSKDAKSNESHIFLKHALESKIKKCGPKWLKAAAALIRLASDSMGHDFFRIHPKGHGSVVIGEHGLRANSLVTYYRGEVYPSWRWCEKLDAIEQTQKKLDLRPNLPDFYNMAMERPMKDPRGYGMLFVDASRKSGLGSSFSHSCDPTCEVRVVALNGRLSLAMTTLRDLERGEELTFDYNAVTESLDEYRFAVCLCGHRKCRGSFLHFATADCYQQVLSRNSPIAVRFANLARGCMKKVMSKEDSELLLKHGFNTAAFGAVSFNHHIGPNGGTPDSIENVPIWLRTYVADTLRYIQYERRALPVALLCNQMEKKEKEQEEETTKKYESEKKVKQQNKSTSNSKQDLAAPSSESVPESKPIAGSKPQPSYFFYVQNHREQFASIVNKDGSKLKGLELSRAINAVASDAWSNLSDKEKQSWKQKAIEDWKKNGGPERARLEEARKVMLATNKQKSLIEAAELMEKQLEAAIKEEGNYAANKKSNGKNDSMIYGKDITFEAADAEGYSAMEQRIQQLAQSLSRVGRVLDRHRENYIVKEHGTGVNSEFLRNLVHTPLSIMSDEEVVKWMWNDAKGVVRTVLDMVIKHFPSNSTLCHHLSAIMENYNILSIFCERYNSSTEIKKRNDSTTPLDARGLLRDALHDFRLIIIEFLNLAESSFMQAARKKKSKKKSKSKKQNSSGVDRTPVQEENDFDASKSDALLLRNQNELAREDEVMRITGGGEGGVAAMDSGSDRPTSLEPVENDSETYFTLKKSNENCLCEKDRCAEKQIINSLVADIEPVKNSVPIRTKNIITTGNTPSEHFGGAMENISRQQSKESKQTSDETSVITPSTTENQENEEIFRCHDDRDCTRDHSDVKSSGSSHLSCGMKSEQNAPSSVESQECEVPSKPCKNSEDSLESEIYSLSSVDQHKPLSGSKPQPTYFYFMQSQRDHFLSMVDEKEIAQGINITTAINKAASRAWADLGEEEKESWKQKAYDDWMRNGVLEKARLEGGRKQLADDNDSSGKDGKEKKRPEPFPPETVKYLTDWLLNPEHILNPYPSAEEKEKIGKDLGLERRQIEGWFSSHRRRIIMPQKQLKKMELSETDIDHWPLFRKHRYMLETTADLLLMYACTNTFFVLKPFIRFDSTPIEVYARELGNHVPRYLAFDSSQNGMQNGMNSNPSTSDHTKLTEIPLDEVSNENKNSVSDLNGIYTPGQMQTAIPSPDVCCSPDDVITTVTVNYAGDYVLTQLLQWFTGGIGQKQGLPDMFGCVMLPPVHGCWDIIDDCKEIKSSNDVVAVTEYKAKIQPRLAEWFDDRTQRGNPWEKDVARYFCPMNGSAPDPTMPMGSPILDYLVTGNNENIISAANALRRIGTDRVKSFCQEVSTTSASDRLKSTVDHGMPAQAIANWVQCENPCCLKWRKLPWHVDVDLLPEKFFCKDNVWNKKSSTCTAPEDEWDMNDAPIKFDTTETSFDIGAWFDVRREGKVGYSEAQVVELDFNSNVKRVKFHFYKTKSEMDEWIEIGSPRIAPHHSYTPTYPGGKLEVTKKKNKSYAGGTKKKKKKGNESVIDESNVVGSSKVTISLKKPSKRREKNKAFKSKKGVEKRESKLPQMIDDQLPHPALSNRLFFNKGENFTPTEETEEAPGNSSSSLKRRKETSEQDTESTVNTKEGDKHIQNLPREMKIDDLTQRSRNEEQSPGPNKKPALKSAKFSQEIYDYLNAWVAKNPTIPVPSQEEKATIMNDTGLERRQLSDWLHRARRKKKRQDVIAAEVCEDAPGATVTSSALNSKTSLPSVGIKLSSTETASNVTNSYIEQQPTQVTNECYVSSLNCPAPEDVAQTYNIETKVNDESIRTVPITCSGSGVLDSSSSAIVTLSQEKGLPKPAKLYLEQWISIPEHAAYPYPSREEKDKIIAQFAIEDKKQLDAWFSNARRNMKKKIEKPSSSSSIVTSEKFDAKSGII
ncbi:hypothetical protein ACHAXS_014443 [Conticribra weissflogii]